MTLLTPQGAITLDLPADLRPAESIVGSVTRQPKGDNDAARNANRMLLDAYTLSVGDQTKSLSDPMPYWKVIVPSEATRRIVLKDPQGVEVAHAVLSVPGVVPATLQNAPDPTAPVRAPSKGQAGRPLTLQAPASGEVTNLQVSIGGKEAPLLAASPRTLIVMTPKDVLGKTQLRMKKGGEIVYEGDYRNERVRRDSPWPWIIVGVIVGVVVVIIEGAASLDRSLHHIGSGIQPINLE